jgi:hypothetical protein
VIVLGFSGTREQFDKQLLAWKMADMYRPGITALAFAQGQPFQDDFSQR